MLVFNGLNDLLRASLIKIDKLLIVFGDSNNNFRYSYEMIFLA